MANRNRQEHAYQGDSELCGKCGHPPWLHRASRSRKRLDTRDRSGRIQVRHRAPKQFFGVDGEGIGRENHRYVLLSCSNIDGSEHYSLENYLGLGTHACLEFLYGLPDYVRLMSYSFNYDLTKILEDLSESEEGCEVLWYLWRPERRQRYGKDSFKGPRYVRWQGWEFNMQGTKFYFRKIGQKKTVTIWDIWKFYQSKFTGACEDWKVGTPEEILEMERMKNNRKELDKQTPEAIRAYNHKECMFMADLTTRLVDAHGRAGLELKTFFGAGSTATAILKKLGVEKYISKGPPEMQTAIAQGYSGGRFDISFIGIARGPVYSYDLSSAYPYQITQLPCLVHGEWKLTKDRQQILKAKAALVHYRLNASVNTNHSWGPFPFREENGSICYPVESPGGWVWRDEYLAGEVLHDGVEFIEAWVYNTDCACEPFKDIPKYYIERCLIGKEGPGIVLKLGINSVYGKIAQSIGRGLYQCWIWAGIITSGCRAQVLHAIALHKNPANLLMIATDGILTKERLTLPRPIDTGTFEVWECAKHKKTCFECSDRTYKPLGGWEEKLVKDATGKARDVFIARPGIYFPMNPSDKDIKSVRARGVGRSVIVENWPAIVSTWESWDGSLCQTCNGVGGKCKACQIKDDEGGNHSTGGWPIVAVDNVGRFCGAKTCISRRIVKDERGKPRFQYHRANGNHMEGEPRYGQWITRKVQMSFNPFPKRDGMLKGGGLKLRRFKDGPESAPYKKARVSPEAKQLSMEQQLLAEQPSGDFAFY